MKLLLKLSVAASGIYLISDGMKRDFGFEGIASLAQLSPQLKELHLADCFRVSNLALKAIGRGLKNLRILSLRNCPNIQEAAMSKWHPLLAPMYV